MDFHGFLIKWVYVKYYFSLPKCTLKMQMRLHWGTWMPYVTLISFMGSLAWLCLYVDRNIIRQKCFYVWFFEFYEVDPIGVYKFYCDSYVKFEDPSFENMHKFVTITINSKPWCKSKLLKYTRKRWQWVQVNS